MKRQVAAIVDRQGKVIVPEVKVLIARDVLARSRGLLWRPMPGIDEAMLISPCAWIHTVGMAYPIDVLFIARDGHVMHVSEKVAPMRMRRCSGARAVLETAPGFCHRHGVSAGCRLDGLTGVALD